MKKLIALTIATALCLGTLAGCSAPGGSVKAAAASQAAIKTEAEGQPAPRTKNDAVVDFASAGEMSNAESTRVADLPYATAYKQLAAFKTEGYASRSVADFNKAIAGKDEDISEALEAYADVIGELPEDDANYDFFRVTLACSLDELYCGQIGDDISYRAYVEKKEGRILPLNDEEEELMCEDVAYEFLFMTAYSLHYSIADQTKTTVGERDEAIQSFQKEFQDYMDTLGKDELCTGNIRDRLVQKSEEIAQSLSKNGIELRCEIANIECHDSGVDSEV